MASLDQWLWYFLGRSLIGFVLMGSFGAVLAAAVDDRASGAYLAKAADCAACHTAPGGKPYAGGLPIASPVGVIYASNITPSKTDGIGNYSEEQFARALRKGIRGDGANLYPAMPYTAYSYLSDADVTALFDYFMHSVEAVSEKAPPTKLAFPLDIRISMKAWNFLFLNSTPFQPDDQRSGEYNRGKYLVLGATHCSTCHTTRGFLMQEEKGSAFAGAQVGPWYAPNVTSDPVHGIGNWSKGDLVLFLRTGALRGKAGAAGSMAEAVEKSFQYLTDADLNAIAAYITTLPPKPRGGDQVQRSTLGSPESDVDIQRGTHAVLADSGAAQGSELFLANCATCHSYQGRGTSDGYYPSLYHNSTVGAMNRNNLVATILNGVDRTTNGKQAYMPGFGGKPDDLTHLSDEQVAQLAQYVVGLYGQIGTQLSSKDVMQERTGGPASPLVPLAQAGAGIGAFLIILCAGFLIRRVRARK